MRQTKYFLKTSKTISGDEVSTNARLLEQAGYISKTMAGVYSFLPIGLRVLTKIETIIREEMDALGANELLLPSLQPKENWIATERWNSLDILFKVKSVHEYEAALGPTHEEIVTPLASRFINSYKDLPFSVYQIQTKFRDEARAKSGLLRGREFRMKDLYSFHTDDASFDEFYSRVKESYFRVFNRLGLPAVYTEASGGSFSKFSHEFQVVIPSGEDTIYICKSCGLAKNKEVYQEGVECTDCKGSSYEEVKACEVGNIFPLKTKFSKPFECNYRAEDGNLYPVIMGCYGIGPSRLMGVIVEKFFDEKGIMWPKSVAPFDVHLIHLTSKDASVKEASDRLYQDLLKEKVSVLYDDRDVSAGEKFADSDLLGIPLRIVVSQKTLEKDGVEVKKRNEDSAVIEPLASIVNYLKNP